MPTTRDSNKPVTREDWNTEFTVEIAGDQKLFDQVSVVEISMMESLLTPSLQTRLVVDSYRHPGFVKDLDQLANQEMTINLERKVLAAHGMNSKMQVKQPVYRVSDRKPKTYQIDEYSITACDESLLQNAATRMSKSWNCTDPTKIVRDTLNGCLKVKRLKTEQSKPKRTFFAENLHPFQVVAKQADIALAPGDDPSFLHFMTYEDLGTHHFRSLQQMTKRTPVIKLEYFEKGSIDETYGNPYAILGYEFPCDFDILSDIMNGVDKEGTDQNSLLVTNPFNGINSILGADKSGCSDGGAKQNDSFTDKDSAQGCEIDVEKHKLKRTARLGLLEQDKVALRMTLAFNPNLHAGLMVDATFWNKLDPNDPDKKEKDYGSGSYLISALTHTIKAGGFSTTVIDCISKSVGSGGATRG